MSRSHPSIGQLRAFSEGNGDDKFRTAMELHLQDCEECRQLIDLSVVSPTPSVEKIESSDGMNNLSELEIPAELVTHPIYELQKLIGRGGMGQVYLAKHRITGRLEAIKILLPHLVSREEIRKRFLREIQAAAQLDHPNICRTLNALSEGSMLGLVMEYLQGTTLHSYIKKKGPIEYTKAIAIALQITAGIEHANRTGMIHRDLKPANVMILKRSNRLQVKILDFGLARIEGNEANDGLTQLGGILGTPEYMSPEQAISPTKVDVRSDLYSIGCILYFMLVGEPPFQGETSIAIIQAKLANQAPSITESVQVPVELANLVARLLAKNPDERPQDAEGVIESLRAIGNVSGSSSKTGSLSSTSNEISPELLQIAKATRNSRSRTRNRSGMWGALLGVLPTIALLIGFYQYSDKIVRFWHGNERAKTTSAIIMKNVPPGVDIFLNNRKAQFLRPADSPHVTVSVLPGTYSVTLKSSVSGEDISTKVVDVQDQRDVFIEFDSKLLAKLQQPTISKSKPDKVAQKSTERDPSGQTAVQKPSPPTISQQELISLQANVKKALLSRNAREAIDLVNVASQKHGVIADQTLESLRLAARQLNVFLEAKVKAVDSMTGDRLILLGKDLLTVEHKGDSIHFSERAEDGKSGSVSFNDMTIDMEVAIVQTALDVSQADAALALGIGIITHPGFKDNDHGHLFARMTARASASKTSAKIGKVMTELPAIIADLKLKPEVEKLNSSESTTLRLIKHSSSELSTLFFLSMDSSATKQTFLLTSGNISRSFPSRLWNIESGEHVIAGNSVDSIRAVERSQNGKILAVLGGTVNPHLKVYALNFSKPRYELSDIDNNASSISLSSDGRTLAACNTAQTFFKWNLQSSTLSHKVACREPMDQSNVLCSCIRADMDYIAVADNSGEIHVWHSADGRSIRRFKGNGDPVANMIFNRRGELIVVRKSGDMALLDVGKETPILSIATSTLGVCKTGFSIESRRFITSDWFNNVRIWDTNTLECKTHFSVDATSEIVSVAVDDLGKTFAIGYENSSLVIGKVN